MFHHHLCLLFFFFKYISRIKTTLSPWSKESSYTWYCMLCLSKYTPHTYTVYHHRRPKWSLLYQKQTTGLTIWHTVNWVSGGEFIKHPSTKPPTPTSVSSSNLFLYQRLLMPLPSCTSFKTFCQPPSPTISFSFSFSHLLFVPPPPSTWSPASLILIPPPLLPPQPSLPATSSPFSNLLLLQAPTASPKSFLLPADLLSPTSQS